MVMMAMMGHNDDDDDGNADRKVKYRKSKVLAGGSEN